LLFFLDKRKIETEKFKKKEQGKKLSFLFKRLFLISITIIVKLF
jgi:hypothetical protein